MCRCQLGGSHDKDDARRGEALPRYPRTGTDTRRQSLQRPVIADDQVQTDIIDATDVASKGGEEIWNSAIEANPATQRPSPLQTRTPVRSRREARLRDPCSRAGYLTLYE